jgi:hypothetical protein
MDYRTRANLRDLLARLYYRDPDIEHVVTTVGLEPAFIEWHDRPVNTWRSVLNEAENHGKLMDVIGLARKEKPNVQSLEMAEKDLLLAVNIPELPDTAWRGATTAADVEKITGAVSTLRPIGFLLRGFEASKPVGRVVLADGSSGSGFLIKGNILITNNHVLSSKDVASTARVEFNYQKSPVGLDEQVDPFDLDPDAVFATSLKEELGGDDWTAVRVKGDPSAKWNTLGLAPLPDGTPKKGDEVIIIQHPGGGQKQIALSHNVVAFADQRRLQYLTDTREGSSGSPVFDTEWRVVALHHKGGSLLDPGSKQAFLRNQGVHINAVIDGLVKNHLM